VRRPGERRGASIRLRLTLSYAGIFIGVGFLLVAGANLLVRYELEHNAERLHGQIATRFDIPPSVLGQTIRDARGNTVSLGAFLRSVEEQAIAEALGVLLRQSAMMLLLTGVVSLALGWFIAGRMLRPVHEITTVARRLSASTLDERIDLHGPPDELKELADTFDDMLDRLAASFRAQREFVANASHELRTPLAIMRTEVDVTLSDPEASAEDLRRMAETLRNATVRSEKLIDSLLVLAGSAQIGRRETVDLSGIAEAALDIYRERASARSLTFDLRLMIAPASGDPALLERLVTNLIDNAVRYAPEGDAIRVSTTAGPSGVTLTVANGGEAIAADEVPRLFERFYRRDASRSRKTGGSGLGLAIVAAVAQAHGGEARAQAPATGGLVVTVSLPGV